MEMATGKKLTNTQLLLNVYDKVSFITDRIKVNGEDGTEPIVGLENILELHEQGRKKANKDIAKLTADVGDLKELTQAARVNRNLRKSFVAWFKTKPILKIWTVLTTILSVLGVLSKLGLI